MTIPDKQDIEQAHETDKVIHSSDTRINICRN